MVVVAPISPKISSADEDDVVVAIVVDDEIGAVVTGVVVLDCVAAGVVEAVVDDSASSGVTAGVPSAASVVELLVTLEDVVVAFPLIAAGLSVVKM